ncbi:hypothetical protein [Flavobacterium cellulosilyticum]|uniref:Uncharacterized protein n=1 Tax=Flavobacterium cellulosilyticum TaxID=2541731 RepID=A0A4R5C9I6_9FLAO|nr:hypothetical protein [Flavobacterium cellulosilyticum]TDD93734.1 hypothetical protein E0F76_18445 [Flavobacterium cellulosilyticum]
MKIAILGWGSLLWQPKDLQFDKEIGWSENGPILPIEFARISKDGRLTLVITKDAKEVKEVKTYFAISNYKTLEEAVLNLAVREGSCSEQIGSYDKPENTFSKKVFFEKNILDWISNTDIDAVIWTNLGENWKIKNEDGEVIDTIVPNERVDYLKKLKNHKRALAEEYIRRTPTQIDTYYRRYIEKELDWKPIS